MARRIALPPADELFADPAPRPGRRRVVVTDMAAELPPSGVTPKQAAARRPRPTPAPRAARPEASDAALVARLDGLEGSLRDLPIDTLLDLRDGLENLLDGDGPATAEVLHLLGRIGA